MRARSTPAVLLVVTILSLVAVARTARAQWTLPQGQGVVLLGYGYTLANTEFLGRHLQSTSLTHGERPFPLAGAFQASAVTLGVRYGVTERFELELDVPLKFANYQSDSINFGGGAIDLSRQVVGVGDLQVAARYRWLSSPIAVSTEVRVKAPTGYTPPTGTFGPNQAFSLADVRPDNVHDDVTLGDGQIDIAVSQLFGMALPTHTFMRLGLGYNFRFGGAADQLLADFRIGQLIGTQVLVYAGVSGVYSVERDTRPIGLSIVAVDATVLSANYTLANLVPQPVYIERDAVDVGGGVIIKLTDAFEVNLNITRTVVGVNTAAATQIGLSVAFRSQWFTPPPPPEPVAPPPPAPPPPPPPPELAPPPADATNAAGWGDQRSETSGHGDR